MMSLAFHKYMYMYKWMEVHSRFSPFLRRRGWHTRLEDHEDAYIYNYLLTISTSFCTHEQKPHGLHWAWSRSMATSTIVKIPFVTLMGLSSQFEAYWSKFFHWDWLIHYAYELLRCLEIEIWWFSWQKMTDKTDCLIPYTCTWRSNCKFIRYVSIDMQQVHLHVCVISGMLLLLQVANRILSRKKNCSFCYYLPHLHCSSFSGYQLVQI